MPSLMFLMPWASTRESRSRPDEMESPAASSDGWLIRSPVACSLNRSEQGQGQGRKLVCLGEDGDPGLLEDLSLGPICRLFGDVGVGDAALGRTHLLGGA